MAFLSRFALWNGMLFWLTLSYYGPQCFPLWPAHELAASSLDEAIPFVPETAWIYQSLFVLMPLAALLQPKCVFTRFAIGFCGLIFALSLIFWLWPTELPAPAAPLHSSWSYTHLIAAVDGRRNAFPSLHAALSVYAGASIIRSYRRHPLIRISMILWVSLLLLSTLTTKQHIFVDLLAGAGAGLLAVILTFSRSDEASPTG